MVKLRLQVIGKQESSDMNPDFADSPNHVLSRTRLPADTLDSELREARNIVQFTVCAGSSPGPTGHTQGSQREPLLTVKAL